MKLCRYLSVNVTFICYNFVDCILNVMAHMRKPDFVFRQNGWFHLNQWGRQFSRLLAADVRASAVVMVVMLDTPCSAVVWRVLYPLQSPVSPSLPLPCVTVCHHISTGVYHKLQPQKSCNTIHSRNIVSFWHVIENTLHKSVDSKTDN